jgi:hypothetical protein
VSALSAKWWPLTPIRRCVRRPKLSLANYLRTGQLKIMSRGVAECKSQLEFWACDDLSGRSSFHRDIASRNEAKHHSLTWIALR